MIADVQRELAEVLATHRLTTPRQCFCGEREPYDERDAGFHRPEWHVAHVLTKLLPLIADAEKRAEERGYERGRRDFQFAPEGDNHHNAALCPYCSPAAALDPSGAAEGAGR